MHHDYEMTDLLTQHREAIIWAHEDGADEDEIVHGTLGGLSESVARDLAQTALAGL